MIKLNINLGERGYPIYITTDFGGLAKCIHSAGITGKLVLITDSNVSGHQGGMCLESLKAAGLDAAVYIMEAGEKNKNLDTVRDIYRFLLEQKLDRNSALMALGGGVVGDIAGFAAATYLRGISFIQIPTSLLAQADSSVGGKVGVDFEGKKNLVGAFYQPRFVYMNVNTLRTLPAREMKSGLAEVIKHGIIRDPEFYEYIDYNIGKIYSFNEDVLQYLAKVNCSIKGRVVEEDEKENDLRAILNFGHTFGHGIESASGFRLYHGEAVSIGMVAACKLAYYMGMVEEELVNRVTGTLRKAGLPVSIGGLDLQTVYELMFHDKKARGGKLNFILPQEIGRVIQCPVEDDGLIKQVLEEVLVPEA